jgi:hypothetical protein
MRDFMFSSPFLFFVSKSPWRIRFRQKLSAGEGARPHRQNARPAIHTDIVNYNTSSHVKLFLAFSLPAVPAAIGTGQRALAASWRKPAISWSLGFTRPGGRGILAGILSRP